MRIDEIFDEAYQRDWRKRRFILILFKCLYQSPFERHQNARFFPGNGIKLYADCCTCLSVPIVDKACQRKLLTGLRCGTRINPHFLYHRRDVLLAHKALYKTRIVRTDCVSVCLFNSNIFCILPSYWGSSSIVTMLW